MKTWPKYYLHFLSLSLAMIICGTFSMKAYAEVDQVELLKENLKTAETVQVYGSGTLLGAYAMENYPDKILFSTAYIGSNTSKINPQSKFIFDFETILGLKKTTYLNEKEILLNSEIILNKKGDVALKKLYAKFENWIIGLHASNFSTQALLLDIISGLPGAALNKRQIQITYKQTVNANFSYSVGIEEPSKWDIYPEKEKEDKEKENIRPNTGIPTLAANLVYNYNPENANTKTIFNLGGLANVISYYDKKQNQSFNDLGFGLNLGAQVTFNNDKKGKLIANVVYGKGIGNYIFDLALLEKEQNTAYLANQEANKDAKKINTLDAWGFHVGAEWLWSPLLRSVVSGGFLQTLEDTTHRTDKKHYKAGYSASANLIYHPTKQFCFGVEFVHGNRTNLDKKGVMANCIQTIAEFKF